MSTKLDIAFQQIERLYGKGSVYRYGDGIDIKSSQMKIIPTGSILLNDATGIGGVPVGRIIEIFGPEGGGKTTLSLHIIDEAQKLGINCVFIDAEHALDVIYAGNIGVNIDDLIISQPDYGEQGLDIMEKLADSGDVGLIVVDSVAALVPRAEIEGEFGDSHMGLHARMMSQALRKLTALVQKRGCCLVFINQIREKIGIVFGNPEVTTGGRALKFFSTLRFDIRRISAVKVADQIVANRTRVKVVKNKLSSPFKQAEFDIRFGVGIDKVLELIDIGLECGILEKSGSWVSLDGINIAQSKDKLRKKMVDDKDLYIKIRKSILGE